MRLAGARAGGKSSILSDGWRFTLNSHGKTPRKLARKASALLSDLQGLGGLSEKTLLDLAALAQGTVERTGRGGDRRSRERTSEASVHRMIVRLWVELVRTSDG